MRPTPPALTAAAVAAAATALALTTAAPSQAAHEDIQVTGLTQNGRLVSFAAGSPGEITSTARVSGLRGRLVGIDYRPATDQLYGVVRGDDGSGRIVVLDDVTGEVVARTALVTTAGAPVQLVGGAFGVDVNPVADALRIVSDSGQNLRVLLSDRAAGATGTTFVDGALSPSGAGVTAAAYTGSDTDPTTGTVLYDLSSTSDRLLLQDPPNAGGLTPVGTGLGVPVTARTGFDIFTDGGVDVALVSTVDRGRASISVLVLGTGAVVPASTAEIGTRPAVVDIAVPTDQ